MSLEDKIEIRLKRVLNDPQTTNRYTDRQDKQNSLRRELILAALAAIFQHRNNQSVDDSGGATVLVEDELDPFSELFAGVARPTSTTHHA
jgi:hypothetical protein